ncbi:MAG TPA: hypothetical protein VGO89_11910 [Streptomyces sp.]|nr:hypothetical protein [Streptomyces sp.]
MDPLRVRVELADEPGALAGLTTALAALGVDVASVDVLEVDGITVVDELVLRLPADVGPRDVEEAVCRAGAGEVLSTHTDVPRGDATVRAIDLVASVLAAGDADTAGRGLAEIAYADAGALLDLGEASRFPLAQRAREQGVPISGRAGPGVSPLAVPSGWVLWLTPAVQDPLHIAVVARRMDVRFSATEAARLRAFVTLLEKNQALRILM